MSEALPFDVADAVVSERATRLGDALLAAAALERQRANTENRLLAASLDEIGGPEAALAECAIRSAELQGTIRQIFNASGHIIALSGTSRYILDSNDTGGTYPSAAASQPRTVSGAISYVMYKDARLRLATASGPVAVRYGIFVSDESSPPRIMPAVRFGLPLPGSSLFAWSTHRPKV